MSNESRPSRVFMVDVLRIIASLQMINGHTLDSLLLPAVESGPIYAKYSWFRGLVSVAFLLVAGMAYYLATVRRFDAHKADPGAIRRRLRRGVDLILIGYLLQLPWGITNAPPEAVARKLHYFMSCGVLQCIGFTLLVLESMTLLFKRPQHVVIGAGVLAFGFAAVAPWLDSLPVDVAPRFVMSWLSHKTGSLFPVAPWSAYMLGGVALGAWVLPRGSDTPLWSRLLRLAVAFALAYGAWRMFKVVDVPFVTKETTYSAKPVAIFDRLRGIVVGLTALAVVCHPIRRLPRVFSVVSRETLAVYVIHLVLLFNPPFRIANRLGHSSHELGYALVVSVLMIVTTITLTMLWHEQKKRGWLQSVRREVVGRLFGSEDGDARVAK